MGLGEIRLGEMGLGEMGLGEMGQNQRPLFPAGYTIVSGAKFQFPMVLYSFITNCTNYCKPPYKYTTLVFYLPGT